MEQFRHRILSFSMLLVMCTQGFAQQKTRPNILFAIMDDATWMHMGAYGCQWVKTPAFDRVARNGILFNRAYTPNAKCAPSRSCIITGRNSWQLEAAANHWPEFPSKFKVVTEVLAENGYHVGFTGKGWAPGHAHNQDGSVRQLLVKAYNTRKTTPPTTGISPIDYAENFNDFLQDKKAGEPFFFWYGGNEPHRSYEYLSGIKKGGKSVSQVPDKDVYSFWPVVDSVKEDLLDYAYEIEYFDKQLAKMLDMLEAKGELHNTLVVVTADNGMPFPRIKGQEYEYSNHLPLAIMWADGIAHPGRTIDDLVSFVDFTPTFLEAAGLNKGSYGMESLAGKSFVPLLGSAASHPPFRDYVLIGKERHDVGRPNDEGYPIRGILRANLLYLQNFKTDRWPAGDPETGYLNTDGGITKTAVLNRVYSTNESQFAYWGWNFGKRPAEELYDIKNDPDCMHNLAGIAIYKKQQKALRSQLIDQLKKEGDPRILGNGDIFDQYPYTDERSAHFYERYMKGEKLDWGWVSDSDFQQVSDNEQVKKWNDQQTKKK